ncbi:hypothetical protein Tcan_13784 [Toxocara canis]|uniref:VMA21-like domain protein n=2 Tax=Toxocara canis TaxID=6265 RepID=A0A0B2VJS0_TOXCA|nr:hypothetical protein Tcan_13784 [Toxocara canis]VDM44173.1 unnamed protein product [Toxocara canis]
MGDNEAVRSGKETEVEEGIVELSSGDQQSAEQSEDETEHEYSTNEEDVVTESSEHDNISTSSEGLISSSDETLQRKLSWVAEDARRKAISYCVIFTMLLFTVPLIAMYLSYRFLFKDYFGFDDATSALYAGGVAASIVLFFMVLFVWIAYREEKRDAMLFKKDV